MFRLYSLGVAKTTSRAQSARCPASSSFVAVSLRQHDVITRSTFAIWCVGRTCVGTWHRWAK